MATDSAFLLNKSPLTTAQSNKDKMGRAWGYQASKRRDQGRGHSTWTSPQYLSYLQVDGDHTTEGDTSDAVSDANEETSMEDAATSANHPGPATECVVSLLELARPAKKLRNRGGMEDYEVVKSVKQVLPLDDSEEKACGVEGDWESIQQAEYKYQGRGYSDAVRRSGPRLKTS